MIVRTEMNDGLSLTLRADSMASSIPVTF